MKRYTATILLNETEFETTITATSYNEAVNIAVSSFDVVLNIHRQMEVA